MAYQVLARKWRPKQFEEVVGQGHVTRTLQNAIKQNKLAHAYLLTGTRGVGKTSIARLFAKAIRCENRLPDFNPCLKCAACLDVDSGSSMDFREIDGASNNSVDDIRALIENVQYLPSCGQYKIYVIDEVHMLSVSAFNALLKTLEEPPAHVLFILATTDPQKLLGTVISRCQRYDFKNVSTDLLEAHLLKIAKAENIQFATTRIPRRLAELGKGSVRDSLSILDQVQGLVGGEVITEDSFAMALGLAASSSLRGLVSSLLKGDVKRCSDFYAQIIADHIDLKKLCDQVLDTLFVIINKIDNQGVLYQGEVIEKNTLDDLTIAELFWIYETLVKDFGWALTSLNPEKVVLVLLQKICLRRTILNGDDVKLGDTEQNKSNTEVTSEAKAEVRPAKTWVEFISVLRQKSPTTAANLEHGNLIEELHVHALPLNIVIAFPEDAAVFKEYLEEKDIFARLKGQLSEYFEVPLEQVVFRTKLLTHEEKKDKNFKTKVEIDDEFKRDEEEAKRQKILTNPFVKEAEKLFNTKVDKIILSHN